MQLNPMKNRVRIDWRMDLPVSYDLKTVLQIVADCCHEKEGIDIPCCISVRFCDDHAIQGINREFRDLEKPTDVLSFPSVSYSHGKTASKSRDLLVREFCDDNGSCFLGDIVISVPHLYNQAAEYGHSVYREASYLLAHGLFHLMGYDHMREEEAAVMREMEEKALQLAGLGREGDAVSEQLMIRLAVEAMKNSYSPYSRFRVGASLRSTDGRFFLGTNIENASYGLSNCAERTAVFKAVSEGASSFDLIVIASEKIPAWPCGACRQVLREFAPDIRVTLTWEHGKTTEKALKELLPESFGPESLLK